MEIIVEEFIKSEKLLQILIKLLNPQILFCKSETSLQIQELSLNLENILQIWKNILQIRKNILSRATCASSQPASEFVSAILPYPKWRSGLIYFFRIFCNVSLMTLEYVHDVWFVLTVEVLNFRRACRYDESLGACRLSRFYNFICKSHSKASLSTLLYVYSLP